MEQNGKRGYENCILAFAVLGASALLMGFFFDFYYDINDDTMMRDIMSGVYSGAPDGHNMQTLYPLGAFIALCYRLYGSFPWYGAFLLLCQFGCFFLAGVRLCTLADIFYSHGGAEHMGVSRRASLAEDRTKKFSGQAARAWAGKLLCLLVLAVMQWGIFLTHMVNTQYTITCGMLVGTAVFLFLAMPERAVLGKAAGSLSVKAFLRGSLPALLLFLLAFQLRSEMALLTLPFLGLAGLFCWWEDRPVLSGKTVRKYGGLVLLLFAGIGISLAADSLAYGGEWKAFRQFFDDRTTIYDFYPEVLSEGIFDEDLEKMGVSEGARLLLANYNFGLDGNIDGQMLSDVAAYARENIGGAKDWGAVFKEKLSLYRYRSFHGEDAPYNLLVFLGYGANIIAAVILWRRNLRELAAAAVQLLLTAFVRSGLWMFVLMRGRDPVRITHPLYLVEFCLLAGIFYGHLRRGTAVFAVSEAETEVPAPDEAVSAGRHGSFAAAGYLLSGAAAALVLLSAWGLQRAFPAVQADQERRQEINRDWEAIDAYCRARPDMFYFEDVYSTVAFSGKLLECRDNSPANYDIAGGWMCKSPLYLEKLAAFCIESAADALAEGDARFIMSDGEKELRGLAWLAVLYAEQGLDVHVEECGRIGNNYGVYQIVPLSENGKSITESTAVVLEAWGEAYERR